jgi:hypothetical protein
MYCGDCGLFHIFLYMQMQKLQHEVCKNAILIFEKKKKKKIKIKKIPIKE